MARNEALAAKWLKFQLLAVKSHRLVENLINGFSKTTNVTEKIKIRKASSDLWCVPSG